MNRPTRRHHRLISRALARFSARAGLVTLNLLVVVALVAGLPFATLSLAVDYSITVTSSIDKTSLTVPPGSRVIWNNLDGNRHRFRSTGGPENFDTGNIDPGGSGSVLLDLEGTYTYVDDRNGDNPAYHGTIVVSAAGTTGPTVVGGGTGAPIEVKMAGRRFAPVSVTIAAGTTVSFVNDDDRDHTATAGDRSFDSGILAPGARYPRTFATAGTFPYICALHPDMTGTVTVTGADGTAPPPATNTDPPPPTVGASDITVFDFGFSPAAKQVSAGATVRFVNTGVALHTVTDESGRFDSGLIAAGGTWTRQFSAPGTYPIICTLHPQMRATLTVVDAAGTAPPAPPPPAAAKVATPPGSIEVRDFSFSPATISVQVGSSLRFVNTGRAPHTVTAADRAFDSGLLQTGQSFSHRFTQPGVMTIVCTLHPQMTARVTVLDASGQAPGSSPATTSPTQPTSLANASIRIIDLDYNPQRVNVPIGTTVVWTNDGVAPHTVTARNATFDSGVLETGGVYSRKFDRVGEFEYFCTLHPNMVGFVTVEGAGPGTAATATDDIKGAATPLPITPDSTEGSVTLGWITVGLVSALVFGGGATILALLRRELLRY